jgi:LysM domain-containing protein
MTEEVHAILLASNWVDYYEAHKRAYSLLLMKRWGLGAGTFAQQLHHTAVPDVSGETGGGTLNWAAYSQPSAKTLEAFVPVFRTVLKAEPHRIRNNRYLFFVSSGNALPVAVIRDLLGDLGAHIDVWSGSLEHELEIVDTSATLAGASALMDCATSAEQRTDWPAGFESMRNYVRSDGTLSLSVVPKVMRLPLLTSSAILYCYREAIPVTDAIAVIGIGSAIAAYIAAERARRASWGASAVAYCEAIAESSETATTEYVVQPGDTLSRVVRERFEIAFHSLWPIIRALNPHLKDPNLILSGQRLLLPSLDEGSVKNP